MGNTYFNENTRVQVPAALHLCKLGYIYLDNICAYDTKTNILIDVFLNAVKRLNPGLSSSEASLSYAKEDKAKVTVDDSYITNLQRIFFIDEAHRGYNPQGSFLANLLEADKNTVKIALTGTPLLKEERESWRVFGHYVHTYYYDKSIADGYTCKLKHEPVETIYKEKIGNILDKLAGDVEAKKSGIGRNQIMEHESYLDALLDYIISDFRRFRKEQNDETVGAMIVCRTNSQARELYRLWQERSNMASKVCQYQEQQMFMAAERNVFAATGTNVSVILFDKSANHDKVILIDASKLGEKYKEENNQKRRLRDFETAQIVNTFQNKEAVDDFSAAVNYDEIKEKGYSLSAGLYSTSSGYNRGGI